VSQRYAHFRNFIRANVKEVCLAMANVMKPGEICSIDQAIQLGVFDARKSGYVAGLEDTRNYSRDNPNDYKKTRALCRQNNDENRAYPLCPLVAGMGFTQVRGDPSKCVTASCPPGFTDIGNNRCEKPKDAMIVDKASVCDGKDHDWFSVPNYHLGNTYLKKGDKCLKPCPSGNMPLVAKDIVDGEAWDITLTSDEGMKCTSKEYYMNGKYKSDPDYCPVAMIKRLGSTPEGLYTELFETASEALAKIPQRAQVVRDIQRRLTDESVNVAMDCHQRLANIVPGSKSFQVACEKLVTPKELQEAFAICKNAKYYPEKLSSKWRTELGNDNADIDDKMNVLKQACTQTFCRTPENAMEINESPLCFDNIKSIDVSRYNAKYAGDVADPTLRANTPETPTDKPPKSVSAAISAAPSTSFIDKHTKFVTSSVRIALLAIMAFGMFIIIFRKLRTVVRKVEGRTCA